MPARLTRSVLVIACTLGVAVATMTRISSTNVHGSTPGIVGTWLLTITPDGGPKSRYLYRATADGAIIGLASGLVSGDFAPQDLNIGSVAGGAWVGAGGNRFKQRSVSMVTDARGHFAGLWTVQTTESVTGSAMTGRSVVTMSAPDGRITFRGTARFMGMRISPPTA